MAPTNPPKSNYFILKSKTELTYEGEVKLNEMGVGVFTRLGSGKYLARCPSDKLDAVRKLDYSAEIYPSILKVHGNFDIHLPDVKFQAGADPLAPVTVTAQNPNKEIAVTVTLHPEPEQTIDQVVQQLSGALKSGKAQISKDGHLFSAAVAIKDLSKIIAVESVQTIDLQIQPRVHNNLARKLIRVPVDGAPGYKYKGADERIAVLDSGFNDGKPPSKHPNDKFSGRIIGLYDTKTDVEYPDNKGTYKDETGHGTHVMGCIVGQGQWNEVVKATTSAEIREPQLVQGTAPEAQVYSLRMVFKDDAQPEPLVPPTEVKDPEETVNVMRKGHDKGCRIVNNSWGSKGLYNAESEAIDKWVLANENTNSDEVFVCWAAGNSGASAGSRSLDLQPVAKNVLGVGASNSCRPKVSGTDSKGMATLRYSAGHNDFQDPEKVASFSSAGPVYKLSDDGLGRPEETRRIKPDVIAPGSLIVAPRSAAITAKNLKDAIMDSGDAEDPGWIVMSGTSMATPIVSGCIAVLRQILRVEHGITHPNACALRALIVNGARSLPKCTLRANWREQGFGRIDLQNSMDMLTPSPRQLHTAVFAKPQPPPGQRPPADWNIHQICTLVVNKGQVIRATLAWTDSPGLAIQSTMNIVVEAPERKDVRYGNHWLPRAGDDDLKENEDKHYVDDENNVQKVEWPVVVAGLYTVKVTCIRPVHPGGSPGVPYAVAWSITDV